MVEKFNTNSKRQKVRSILFISTYIILMIIAAIVFSRYVDQESLQRIIVETGWLGVVAYFLIEVVYVTLTPLFNTFILIASGYIFGGHLGFIINFLATTCGLFLIILLVKKYGRPMLKRIISVRAYSRFDQITQKVGPITLLVVYILPFTPDDELTYIVAAGPIRIKRFVIPILLGSLAKAAYSYIGALGVEGIIIAFYTRSVLLLIGLVLVGTQEYLLRNKSKRI